MPSKYAHPWIPLGNWLRYFYTYTYVTLNASILASDLDIAMDVMMAAELAYIFVLYRVLQHLYTDNLDLGSFLRIFASSHFL